MSDFHRELEKHGVLAENAVDYSYKELTDLKPQQEGGKPISKAKKSMAKGICLNNNKLKSMKNIGIFIDSVLQQPDQLNWIDFSNNLISMIDEDITNYPHIKFLYFHGNKIADLKEIRKLRPLRELRSLTFTGNPITKKPEYREFVVERIPQLSSLDFWPVEKTDSHRRERNFNDLSRLFLLEDEKISGKEASLFLRALSEEPNSSAYDSTSCYSTRSWRSDKANIFDPGYDLTPDKPGKKAPTSSTQGGPKGILAEAGTSRRNSSQLKRISFTTTDDLSGSPKVTSGVRKKGR